MSDISYLIVHKDHLMDPRGFNGGAEMASIFLARFLARAGKRVIVAAQLKGEEGLIDGAHYWDLGKDYDVASVLKRASSQGQYYLISAGRALPLVLSQADKNCLSRVLITHDRSGDDTGLKVAIVSRLADQIICVSNAQRDVLVGHGAATDNIQVINNGVDLDLYTASRPEERNLKNLVFAGALVQDKGIHFLIESFAQLKAKYADLTLDVYGTASLWGRKEFFDPQQVERQLSGIKFHGNVQPSQLAQAYKKAGICVFPSIWFEPFGLCAADALATGCPVVAFDVGGPRDIVINNETGVLLQEISVPALTRALDELLSNPQRVLGLSQKILEKARSRFDWASVAEKMASICESAAQKRLSQQKVEAGAASSSPTPSLKSGRVGYLTTWNQHCGLATYARYMLSAYEPGSYVVFGEEAELAAGAVDEPYVLRCWKRGSADFSKLLSAIERFDIRVLHLNCHNRFFPQPQFSQFVSSIRAKGVKVVVQLHNSFTLDASLQALVSNADKVLVHTAENRLEVIANGARPETLQVLTHGVQVLAAISDKQRDDLRSSLGIPSAAKAVVSFGFIQPHKGMEGLIEGVAHLRSKGQDVRGYIVGSPMKEDPNSVQYSQKLQELIRQLKLENYITILNRFVDDNEVSKYLQAADVVLMNYRSQYYEASGACSLAIGAGAVVAASIAPPFAVFSDALWHITTGYPVQLALEVLLSNEDLRKEIRERARLFCQQNSWQSTAKKLNQIYGELGVELRAQPPISINKETDVEQVKQGAASARPFRVLINNRPNMYNQAGGDTVLIEKMVEGLRARAVQVTVGLDGRESPADYDLVHIFNFALPDLTRQFAERAKQAGVPFVVTTLCEDVPLFHTQSRALAAALVEYTRQGQDANWWQQNKIDLSRVPSCQPFDNSWTAENAAALLANGQREVETLRRQYPRARQIAEIKLGFEVGARADASLFEREYGVKDFVLCVGRIESRKNQLMLLKALEKSDLTVVLAGGGFSYQPDYDQAVRSFKRKGKTLVLGRLSAEMLASAYAAAKVHVLPSWYELPGLVSLEAACHNCNVVVTENGTASDYFGDSAFYCDPANERSIFNAVIAAYNSPLVEGLREKVMANSWDKAAAETLSLYEGVLNRKHMASGQLQPQAAVSSVAQVAMPTPVSPVQSKSGADIDELVAKAEREAKSGNFIEANKSLDSAEAINPNSVLLLRTRGVLCLTQGNVVMARKYFEKALKIDSLDARSLSGMGLCEMNDRNIMQAYTMFVQALQREPEQVAAIHQLLRCSYELGRFDDLERALKFYVARHSSDIDMEFCLAGCLFKQNKVEESKSIVKRILALNPQHKGALELDVAISKQQAAVTGSVAAVAPVAKKKGVIPSFPDLTKSAAVVSGPSANAVAANIAQAINNLTAARPASLQSPVVPAVNTVVPQPQTQPLAPLTAIVSPSGSARVADAVLPAMLPRQDAGQSVADIEEDKRAGRFDKASKSCAEMLERKDLNEGLREKVLCLQAELKAIADDVVGAKAQFESIIKANPRCVRAICGLGAIAGHQERWEEAKRNFESALQIQPESDIALAGLGLYHVQRGDKSTAWDLYSRALKANPESLRALLGLVELGYSMKRLPEMEQAVKNYLEMHPADIEFLYTLAGCYYAQNKITQATSEIEKILLFKPDHKNALELQGMINAKESNSHRM